MNTKFVNYANRGMTLEEDINHTNEYYLIHDIAVIYKKPTPIKVIKTNYNKAKINEAYFATTSTLDYNGIYKGKYIEFDCKETSSKTSFPLLNIHKHQLNHLEKILKHGGICFLIIRFSSLNKTYLLMGDKLVSYIEKSSRKSIPISYFEDNCPEIILKYSPRLDYISVIDKIINKKGSWYNEEKKEK